MRIAITFRVVPDNVVHVVIWSEDQHGHSSLLIDEITVMGIFSLKKNDTSFF